MHAILNTPLRIGSLTLKHRLIQGPLAGFSCAPFRELFSNYTAPAYCVTEMLSAHDVLHKHQLNSRYLYRAANEDKLCYQISGNDPEIMANAAAKLEALGADLIDINCGCPKPKIRKKGAGSALIENPEQLIKIIHNTRRAIKCPLTIKIRLMDQMHNIQLAKQIEHAGADAIIVHGRRWTDDYDVPNNYDAIAHIKNVVNIPVITNGDISDLPSLQHALTQTHCDAFMIGRAGTGRPWLFQELLANQSIEIDNTTLIALFMKHLNGLSTLENEHKAILQSKSLLRYYFKHLLEPAQIQSLYQFNQIKDIAVQLTNILLYSEPLK